jgi:putative phosphoribosyl transferase
MLGTHTSRRVDRELDRSTFHDRNDAGRRLGALLRTELTDRRDPLVLGLARGGVIVAAEAARAIGAELDVLTVRKLGAPHQPELAVGAIASREIRVLDEGLARRLGLVDRRLELLVEAETEELRRHEALYRAGRPPIDARDRTVIVVDDGIATGWTMLAALRLVETLSPWRTVVAVPVAPAESRAIFEAAADQFLCVELVDVFVAVGAWYQDFHPVGDDEVIAALGRHRAT